MGGKNIANIHIASIYFVRNTSIKMNLFWMFYHTQQNATLIDIIFKGGSDAGVTTVDADWPGGLPGKDW